MTPRGFDRYMVKIGMGTHPKFARLTDAEFRAHVVGVLAIAASATERGCLMVGHLPAEPIDIAATAGVTEKVARSAMSKLEAVGVLQRDDEHGCLRVHDWNEINPPPGSSVGRMRRHRASQTNGIGDADVTPSVTEASHDPPSAVTEPSHSVTETSHCPSPEVEVEVEVEVEGQKHPSAQALFEHWCERCGHQQAKPTRERLSKIRARLSEGYTADQIRQAIEGAARAAFTNDAGKRFDDIELICRNGVKLESFIERATATPVASRPRAGEMSELDRKRLESAHRLMNRQGAA